MPKRVNVIKEKKSRLKENEETPKQSATLDNGLDEGKKKNQNNQLQRTLHKQHGNSKYGLNIR